jgi:lipoyl-dependent peroxiredoxin
VAVTMWVEERSLSRADLAALAREAHEKICPSSRATRGNVDVPREIVGA